MPKLRKKVKSAVPFNPGDFVELARDNPYIHRLLEDSSIRENAQLAFDSGRKAVDRLNSAKNPAKALLEDRKLQGELRTALEAIRDASTALAEGPKGKAKAKAKARKAKRKGAAARTVVLLGLLGGAGAVGASEKLRGKVLDLLFGAEEEFQYTPPAEPASTSAAPPVSAV
jgi:hypothetical protein